MYVEKRLELLKVGASAPDDVAVADVAGYSYLVLSPCSVDKLLVSVTTVIAGGGTSTVELKRRPTFGSAVGEVVLASMDLDGAAGVAVGQTLQKTFKSVKLAVGDELVFEVAANGATGNALYGVECDNCPEEPGNNSELSEQP